MHLEPKGSKQSLRSPISCALHSSPRLSDALLPFIGSTSFLDDDKLALGDHTKRNHQLATTLKLAVFFET